MYAVAATLPESADPPSVVQQLCTAAEVGDIATVVRLADRNTATFSRDLFGQSLLHIATLKKHNDIVLFLCTLGVDVNVRDSDRQTPLHNAVRNRNLEAIKILLAHHADRTLVDIYRRTPADWAQTDPEVYLALTGESLSVNAHAAAAADDAGTTAAAGSTPSSEAGTPSTVASSATSSAGDAAQVAMLSRALLQLQEQHQQRSNEFKYQLIATQKEVGELKARVVELERLVSAFQLIIKHNHGHSDISS